MAEYVYTYAAQYALLNRTSHELSWLQNIGQSATDGEPIYSEPAARATGHVLHELQGLGRAGVPQRPRRVAVHGDHLARR